MNDAGPRWLLPALGAGLFGAVILAATTGSFVIPPGEVAASVLRRLGRGSATSQSLADSVLWGIRLPRILLGVAVGAGLAVAGAVLQRLFRNGLADPQLLGLGPGAALCAAAVAMVAAGPTPVLVAGTVGGMLAAISIARLGRRTVEADPTRLLMIGIALGAGLAAWTGLFVFAGDSTRVPPVEFWLLGSLAGSTWGVAAAVGGITLAGSTAMFAGSATLDLMVLGRREARHLGVDVATATDLAVLVVGAMVGVAVGAAGVVAFVGLVGPHVVRRSAGPRMRRLLPAAALAGAIFVVLADTAARTVIAPAELPVGLVTAVVGGPYLLWLVTRRSGA